MVEISVNSSGLAEWQHIDQGCRGVTSVLERPHLPFSVRRIYTIQGVQDPSLVRGGHAHRVNDQIIFVLKGEMTLFIDDGERSQTLKLTSQEPGIRLKPMLWHSMTGFSSDCLAIVFASHVYDAADYIADYEEFKHHARTV